MLWLCLYSHLAIRGSVDAVVIDPALVAERDGPLAWAALTLPHEEAAVDATAEQVLSSIAGHRPMVPAVLLQTVDWRDVVTGHPALAILSLRLTPLPIVIVAQHSQLLP